MTRSGACSIDGDNFGNGGDVIAKHGGRER